MNVDKKIIEGFITNEMGKSQVFILEIVIKEMVEDSIVRVVKTERVFPLVYLVDDQSYEVVDFTGVPEKRVVL